MTVTRCQLPGSRRSDEVEGMLQKHWGTTRTVEVSRGGDKRKGIGISIVGGKVRNIYYYYYFNSIFNYMLFQIMVYNWYTMVSNKHGILYTILKS